MGAARGRLQGCGAQHDCSNVHAACGKHQAPMCWPEHTSKSPCTVARTAGPDAAAAAAAAAWVCSAGPGLRGRWDCPGRRSYAAAAVGIGRAIERLQVGSAVHKTTWGEMKKECSTQVWGRMSVAWGKRRFGWLCCCRQQHPQAAAFNTERVAAQAGLGIDDWARPTKLWNCSSSLSLASPAAAVLGSLGRC